MTEYNPGGDMTQGVTRAHVETPEEIAADPIETPAPAAATATVESYKTQHAKVLRFEVSIGKDDDDRTLEQFEQDVRLLLMHGSDLVLGEGKLPPHNITTSGAYYIIDGKVCLPADYDPATKNRKPGTFPPVWAGGPNRAATTQGYIDSTSRHNSPAVDRSTPTPVSDLSDKEGTVKELAEGIKGKLANS